jgi:hypothetical protein
VKQFLSTQKMDLEVSLTVYVTVLDKQALPGETLPCPSLGEANKFIS